MAILDIVTCKLKQFRIIRLECGAVFDRLPVGVQSNVGKTMLFAALTGPKCAFEISLGKGVK